MLKLLLGRANSGKTSNMIRSIADSLRETPALIIVPQNRTHEMEWLLCSVCGNHISRYAEVLSLQRLSSRVASAAGGGAEQYLDACGRILTARLALTSISSHLKVFGKTAGRSEFLSGMVGMIDEFKSCSVSASDLNEIAGQTEGVFSEKLSELSLILGAYDAVMAQGTRDPADSLDVLCQRLKTSLFAKNREIYVDGFTRFNEQEFHVIKELLRQCINMTMTVSCDDPKGTDVLFSEGRETVRRLVEAAVQLGISCSVTVLDEKGESAIPLQYLERCLFDYRSLPYKENASCIRMGVFNDRMEECRAAAEEIKQLAMQGIRWREIAVTCGDPGAYGPIIEAVCREMQIPIYTGMKESILGHSAISSVLLALEAVTDGFETRTVLAYLRSGYADISHNECDLLDNYAVTWTIRGSRWKREWVWNPDGYDGKNTEEQKVYLKRLNEIKERALSPLFEFESALRRSVNMREMMQALYRFLLAVGLYETLEEKIQQLTDTGEHEKAQETAQVFNLLVGCMDQIVAVLGETDVSLQELERIMKLALGQYQIGTIPAVLDSVQFGNIENFWESSPKVMFVLGLNEGVLPAYEGNESLLSEQDRTILQRDFNLTLSPVGEASMNREMYGVYAVLTAPKDFLYVSCAESDQGTSIEPSFVMERLSFLFPNSGNYSKGIPAILNDLTEYLDDPSNRGVLESCQESVPGIRNLITEAQLVKIPRDETVSSEHVSALLGNTITLTASRMDQYGNCPLSYFLNYGLHAKPVEAVTFDAAEFGTFIHTMLEKGVPIVCRGGQAKVISKEESAGILAGFYDEYLESRLLTDADESARSTYLMKRNGEEAALLLSEISAELSESKFVPVAYELYIGGKHSPIYIQAGDASGALTGLVDRTDAWQSENGIYYRVMDYKTGTKKFDFTELHHGVGLQMLLYLFAMQKQGIPGLKDSLLPAGVCYIPAKHPFISVSEPPEKQTVQPAERTGIILAEPSVIEAMESSDKPRFLPKTRVTEAQMEQLREFVSQKTSEILQHIAAGEFEARPFYRGPSHDPCGWCDYAAVCQKLPDYKKKCYVPKVTEEEFWKEAGHG